LIAEFLEYSADFGTKSFHFITLLKFEGVLQVLEANYNVIFIDPDIALLRNPIPYLIWKNVDYVHSLNWVCPQ
jgi:hypothetical protein